MQPGLVQAVGAAGEQDAITGLLPIGQRVGEAAEQQFARIGGHAVQAMRDRHLVEAVEQQERAAGIEMRPEQGAGQSSGGDPSTQSASAFSRSARCQVRSPRPQFILRQNSRSGTSSGSRLRKFAGTGSAKSSGAGTGWVRSRPGDALQHRPAAEGGLAGAGRRRHVEGLLVEALQQRDRFLFFRLFALLFLPRFLPQVREPAASAPARRRG